MGNVRLLGWAPAPRLDGIQGGQQTLVRDLREVGAFSSYFEQRFSFCVPRVAPVGETFFRFLRGRRRRRTAVSRHILAYVTEHAIRLVDPNSHPNTGLQSKNPPKKSPWDLEGNWFGFPDILRAQAERARAEGASGTTGRARIPGDGRIYLALALLLYMSAKISSFFIRVYRIYLEWDDKLAPRQAPEEGKGERKRSRRSSMSSRNRMVNILKQFATWFTGVFLRFVKSFYKSLVFNARSFIDTTWWAVIRRLCIPLLVYHSPAAVNLFTALALPSLIFDVCVCQYFLGAVVFPALFPHATETTLLYQVREVLLCFASVLLTPGLLSRACSSLFRAGDEHSRARKPLFDALSTCAKDIVVGRVFCRTPSPRRLQYLV